MVEASTAKAGWRFGTIRAFMWGFSTLLAASSLTTGGATVPKPLTLEASERVGDEDTNFLAEPTDRDLLRQSGSVEREDEQTSVLALAVTEGGQTADVGHPITPEIGQNLFLGHVSEFWSKNCTLAGVATFVERNCDCLVAESGSLQESLCVLPSVGFDHERTVRRSLYLNLTSTADFIRPLIRIDISCPPKVKVKR